MATVGSATSTASSLDQLCQQYRSTLTATTTDPLQTQSDTLASRVSAISALKTKLNALYTSAKSLGAVGASSAFSSFGVESSQSTVVDGSATGAASIGSHTIDSVTRLAKADVLLSSQFTGADTSMITSLGSGVRTFSINGVQVSVTLTDGQTNDQVLSAITNAVNTTSGIGVAASVLHIDATHSELAFSSRTTGTANRISSFTEGNSTIGALLGFGGVNFTDTPGTTPRTIASPTQAGFIEGYSGNLDASFSLDGVAMTRGNNSITDAVNGMTFKLKSTSSTAVSLTVSPNNTAIETAVKGFLTNYNTIITYLQTQTAVDAKAGTRGPFADDTNVRYLSSDLRALMLHSVSGVDAGAPSLLSAIGVTTADDGQLTLSDTTKFEAALAANPKQVSDLFNSSNGVATVLQAKLHDFVSYGGTLDSETKTVNKQIKNISDRMTIMNARIDKQVAAYRQQFINIQDLLNQAQQQQMIVQSFTSYTSVG